MGVFSAIRRWWGNLFSQQGLKQAFNIDQIAVSTLMLSKQELYRQIMRGSAPWNDKNTPSLMLASVVVNETTDEVLNDFKTEIIDPLNENPNPRADFLNQQYEKFIDNGIEETVIDFLSEGESILKPYMTIQGVDVTVCTTDSYSPLAYNSRGWLIDVVFGATTMKQNDNKTIYKLFERHIWNEEEQSHNIEYKAYKSVNSSLGVVNSDSVGASIPLSEVPEWAHLQDVTIWNMQQPLFVHIRNKAKFKLESPQLQGLPIFAKSVESGALEKLDKQEARTDWEFEGGELAIDAPLTWFKKDESGNAIIPSGKKRLFRVHGNPKDEKDTAETFSPDLRIVEHGARLNQLRRDIELQTGMSYGIISDNNQLDRTAEEFRSSKKRLINTVMQTQKITGVAIDALIYSWDRLLDINSNVNVPAGEYEVVKQWNESLAADRPREFDERKQAQGMGWISQVDNFAWFQDLDIETAKVAVAELNAGQMSSEF